jgi:hypothetical protein
VSKPGVSVQQALTDKALDVTNFDNYSTRNWIEGPMNRGENEQLNNHIVEDNKWSAEELL